MNPHGIGWAMAKLQLGEKVCRKGWNGKGQYLELMTPIAFGKEALQPYVLIKTVQDTFVPWTASQTDLLATDWELRP